MLSSSQVHERTLFDPTRSNSVRFKMYSFAGRRFPLPPRQPLPQSEHTQRVVKVENDQVSIKYLHLQIYFVSFGKKSCSKRDPHACKGQMDERVDGYCFIRDGISEQSREGMNIVVNWTENSPMSCECSSYINSFTFQKKRKVLSRPLTDVKLHRLRPLFTTS